MKIHMILSTNPDRRLRPDEHGVHFAHERIMCKDAPMFGPLLERFHTDRPDEVTCVNCLHYLAETLVRASA